MISFAKICIAFVFITIATAIPVDFHSDDVEDHGLQHVDHEELTLDYHAEPKYSFQYGVHDPHTGDEKQHIEERDGDVVKGTYTLKEADGTTRVVHYQADKHNGFTAQVHKIGHPQHEEHHY